MKFLVNIMFKRVITVIIAILILIVPLNIGVSAENSVVVDVEFSNATSGCIGGTITINCPVVENGKGIKLFWGDSEGNKLAYRSGEIILPFSEFATATVQNGSAKITLNAYTAIPPGASNILIFEGDNLLGVHDLVDERLYNGELLYNFGALSDVHFGRYFSGKYPTIDDAETTFDNALDLFENIDKIDLVAISGDLTVAGEELSLQKYNTIISGREFPVYSCTGNHDMNALGTGIWKQYVNNDVYRNYKDMPEILSVKGNDFVYRAPGGNNHDVFIFLSQHTGHYGSYTSELLSIDQLEWLEEQLEKHKDETVYLFFHTFLTDMEGGNLGCGNAVSSTGVSYTLPFTYRCEDEIVFRNLLIKYKNVMFFSGHSHFEYSLQNSNINLNVYDREGTTGPQIHLSSVTAPRNFNKDGNTIELQGKESQGSLVSVYKDKIFVYGIDFKNQQILSYATYAFNKTVPPEKSQPNENGSAENEELDNAKTDIKKQASSDNSDTSSNSNIVIWISAISAFVIIILTVIVVLVIRKRKKNK